jgi:hypothetical protein
MAPTHAAPEKRHQINLPITFDIARFARISRLLTCIRRRSRLPQKYRRVPAAEKLRHDRSERTGVLALPRATKALRGSEVTSTIDSKSPMERRVASFANASTTAQDAINRARLYSDLEASVKELVNLLVPSEMMLNKASAEGVVSDDGGHITIRRDELDSLVHLVGHARVVADRLRDIMRAAKINVDEPRVRDDSWKKDPRESLRPVKSA